MNSTSLVIKNQPIDELIPYARNSRTHSDEQVAQIAASLREFGWTNPILLDSEKGLIAGHGRLLAAHMVRRAGASIPNWPDASVAPTIELAHMTEAQKRAYVIADNKLAENAGWDRELLALELGDLQGLDFDLGLLGFDTAELDDILGDPVTDALEASQAKTTLAERFLIPPFTVLNARDGWWQDRKRAWLAMGLSSGQGRREQLAFSLSSQPPHVYAAKNAYEAKLGREVSWQEFADANPDVQMQTGTSIFDPVLCEVAYRWFTPPGGVVLDPFAGGSVRGVVASKLGRQYVGCDLRHEQVTANRDQWDGLGFDECPTPVWHCGDSRQIDQHAAGVEADFVFSCPPYADLEVYSENPADLSTMDYSDFVAAYREIIAKAVALLKQDRFACFVVGDVRDKAGHYRNFVADTIAAFVDAGANYYNEAVLVTQAGSLAIRAGKTFSAGRKLGKSHQNVLVFVKGDWRKATAACGVVEVDDGLFPEAVD